ncbi:MAG: DUF4876 domain-containing protein [Bacteroidaceae bacterium]|nr:DUF4876 domain-containing protein [Bacteroidaceae bacterium]
MKKFLNYGLALLAVALASPVFVACDDDDDVKTYDLTVELVLPEGVTSLTDLEVKATKGTATTNIIMNSVTGTVNLPQGSYDITVKGAVAEDVTAKVQGTAKVDLYENTSVKVKLDLIYESPLLFKEIFCAGGKAGYTQDTYFEIVNNSDEVQYLDQLVMLYGSAAQKAPNAWQASGVTDIYYQSQGSVVAFPGSGKDYPIQPGQSVVIANDATNHQTADPDGIHSDLSKADWEIYLEYSRMGDTDYEAPNLSPIFYNNAYMRAFALGFFNGAYILAKLPVTPEEYASDSTSYSTTPGTTSATLYMGIASKYVLDAVEAWDRDDAEHYPYFLPKDDAHAVWAPVGFEGKALRRKVAKIENGRVYYKDTNNSSEDFLTDQPQTPGIAPTAVDK